MARTAKVDQTLDCKGLLCPLPVIRTKQAIDKMSLGQVLEMVSTDPGSVADMQAWSKRTGHELIEHRQEDGLFQFYIRKTK
jgi:tRNA 2-thiouridine synthesizing protein A